jgi:hypothetical protein
MTWRANRPQCPRGPRSTGEWRGRRRVIWNWARHFNLTCHGESLTEPQLKMSLGTELPTDSRGFGKNPGESADIGFFMSDKNDNMGNMTRMAQFEIIA